MGGGGQRGGGTTIQQAAPNIAPELSPLVSQSAARFSEAQKAAPGIETLLTPSPQNIPGQTPIEQLLSALQIGTALPGGGTPITDASGAVAAPTGASLTAPGNATSPEVAALQQIVNLTSGPVGSSPSTKQGISAIEDQFTNTTLPTIQNQLMLAGLGNSGAMGDALAKARSGVAAAEVPLLQQEVQDRMNAVNQLAGLGNTFATRGRGDVATALQTAGTPREIQTQQEQAKFLDTQRIQALIEQLTMGPLNIFGPSLIGQAGTTTQKFNTSGAGMLGSLIGGGAK